MREELLKQLEVLIAPIVEGYFCQLWGIEYIPHRGSDLLRIFIDNEDGVTIEDCEKVSRQASSLLDVEAVLPGQYILEVSSPGLDRPLFKLSQYMQFKGVVVSIKLKIPLDGRRKYKGVVQGVHMQHVAIAENDDEYLLPIKNIDKGRVII